MRNDAPEPRWIENLRTLMAQKSFNPRSLSLKAGLNPTAVRDMLEGRAKFPRYDTVEALAHALEVTPAQLMGGKDETIRSGAKTAAPAAPSDETASVQSPPDPLADDDLNLLTEIITRLHEVAEEHKQKLAAPDFAAMVTTIYRHMQNDKPTPQKRPSTLTPTIESLMTYETLRKQAGKRK